MIRKTKINPFEVKRPVGRPPLSDEQRKKKPPTRKISVDVKTSSINQALSTWQGTLSSLINTLIDDYNKINNNQK